MRKKDALIHIPDWLLMSVEGEKAPHQETISLASVKSIVTVLDLNEWTVKRDLTIFLKTCLYREF